jgi:hypothetical protein
MLIFLYEDTVNAVKMIHITGDNWFIPENDLSKLLASQSIRVCSNVEFVPL